MLSFSYLLKCCLLLALLRRKALIAVGPLLIVLLDLLYSQVTAKFDLLSVIVHSRTPSNDERSANLQTLILFVAELQSDSLYRPCFNSHLSFTFTCDRHST